MLLKYHLDQLLITITNPQIKKIPKTLFFVFQKVSNEKYSSNFFHILWSRKNFPPFVSTLKPLYFWGFVFTSVFLNKNKYSNRHGYNFKVPFWIRILVSTWMLVSTSLCICSFGYIFHIHNESMDMCTPNMRIICQKHSCFAFIVTLFLCSNWENKQRPISWTSKFLCVKFLHFTLSMYSSRCNEVKK